MPLRCPRFSGDPILEACLDGTHRMLAPETGLPVKRVQAALNDLGFSVGQSGADGTFGNDTGTAVSSYKVSKGLAPSDPVVGPGTMQALDDDLFFDPPTLDPTFREFSPSVVAHRVEPFVGLELAAFIGAPGPPLNSWRHVIGLFALANLNSGQLLGIVANSRAEDLRAPFLAAAAPVQSGGMSANDFFTQQAGPPLGLGTTITFAGQSGATQAFILIDDNVILGRAAITRSSTGQKAPEVPQDTVAHELTHVRNLAIAQALLATADTDNTAYADTALAQAQSATGSPTARVLREFADEITARYVGWVVRKEVEGNPAAIPALAADQLAAAARFYFVDTLLFDSNGYVPGINAQGDAISFAQLDRWLRTCAAFSFTDDGAEEARTKALFNAAAAICADPATTAAGLPAPDGLSPLPQDFH